LPTNLTNSRRADQIARDLLKGNPLRMVASDHDTSTVVIEQPTTR